MRLLVATDHSFLRHSSGVFDTYCFDKSFFDDYQNVFDQVEVISRVIEVETLPTGASRSDGNGLRFTDVPGIYGINWLLGAGRVCESTVAAAVNRVDAVVARVPSQLGRLVAKQARRVGKPYMIEVIGDPAHAVAGISRGLRYPLYKLAAELEAMHLRRLAKYAEVGSYVSKHHLQRAYPLSKGVPRDSISSIRLDAREVVSPRDHRTPSGRFKIILVASLVPIKRHEDLIHACHCVLDQGVDVELHFAGDGPRRAGLEGLCRLQEMDDRVVFHGHIADKGALIDLLDECDLFVMTSASEGYPRAVLEAMARGLPVVGTRVGGVAELVRESELFPVGDATILASLIVDLVRDPRRLNEMSHYSIKMAKQHTCDVLSPQRVRLYKILREKAAER